jgi:acetyl-CoA carboxylase carboxyl transferase subunit beta
MNWYSNVVPPKIKALIKREAPENLWVKCPESGQLVFHKDIEANLYVVPGSGYHMRCPIGTRLANLFDNGECELVATPEAPCRQAEGISGQDRRGGCGDDRLWKS